MSRHPLRTHLYLMLLLPTLLWVGVASVPSASRAPATDTLYLPLAFGPPPDAVVIAAAHIDPARSGEADEALLLWNVGVRAVDLAGWRIVANGRAGTFPAHPGLVLSAGARLWCAAGAAAFAMSFGHAPGCEWAADDDPALPNLSASPRLTNSGGVIHLVDPAGRVVDTLLYGQASGPVTGWQGAAAQLYTRGAVAATGQVWERKRDPIRGLPLDSDRAADWSGDLSDIAWGRRVRFPGWAGWDDAGLARPPALTTTAIITVAVAPEGLYVPIAAALDAATMSLDLSLYTFEHPELAEKVAAAAQRGVRVRLLLEGGPPGGVSDLQRWCVRRMAQAGVTVRYLAMQEGAPAGMQPRYRYTHAKTAILDNRVVLVGSENFSRDAMPLPAPLPQGGRRGAYLLVDSPEVAAVFARLFALDWAPEHFLDLQPYMPDHARYGDPPPDYVPPVPALLVVEEAPFGEPVTTHGPTRFILVSAPENALRPDAGLFALLARAGAGDELLWMQLYEHKYWGYPDSNPIADPNPRLEALLAAARRGARVRVLLDSHFDNPEAGRSNRATAAYLNNLAVAEGLDLQALTGNPTRRGLHAKIILLRIGDETWSAVGSLNGGEISHKVNREVLLWVDHPSVYTRLQEVFRWDWERVK